MKKIFAILVSLLFVASVFGVAQTMAQTNCPGCKCDTESYYKISRTSVHVGETFTLSIKQECYPSAGALEFKTEPGKFNETIQYDPATDLKTENGLDSCHIQSYKTWYFNNYKPLCSMQ